MLFETAFIKKKDPDTSDLCYERKVIILTIHSKLGKLVILQGESKMPEMHIQTKVTNIKSTLPSQPLSFSLFLLSSLVFQTCLPRLIPNSVWVLRVQDMNSGEDCCLCTLPLHCLVFSSQCQSLSTQQLITLARWLEESTRAERCEGQRVRMRERERERERDGQREM